MDPYRVVGCSKASGAKRLASPELAGGSPQRSRGDFRASKGSGFGGFRVSGLGLRPLGFRLVFADLLGVY